jgi:kynurenine formamidase
MEPASGTVKRQTVIYGTAHSLQTLQLTLINPGTHPNKNKLFIIYIHGGAWRDPLQSSADFDAAMELILKDEELRSRIAGLAAVNYGLSPTPSEPSDDVGRNYVHPQHIEDVRLALDWLSANHAVGSANGWGYVLVGHSCGATMAFQIPAEVERNSRSFGSPRAVVGIEGIYDLPLLVKNHENILEYRQFVEGAFGKDERAWSDASPALQPSNLKTLLQKIDVVVIAHSSEDELVELEQPEVMTAALMVAFKETPRVVDSTPVFRVGLTGTHDEVWQQGHGVYKAVAFTIEKILDDRR